MKVMAFRGISPVRYTIAINNIKLDQVSSFQCLGCNITYQFDEDIEDKQTSRDMWHN